jgi:Uma2 family endonuclease
MQSTAALALWPPDDTEESVLGTPYHQTTITNVRVGINEAAAAATPPGGPLPWQAGSQSLIFGLRRRHGTRYKVLPDVFVYRRPFDIYRPSLILAQDGPPTLVVEVLSPENWDSDIDLEWGKPWSYADAGVAEYLILDPGDIFLSGERGQGWRLQAGRYVPWERDAASRWVSALGFAIGYEGAWAVVYGVDGLRIPPEGDILRSLAEREERGRVEGLARGRAEGLVEGEARGEIRGQAAMARTLLRRLLARRFQAVPDEVVARLERIEDLALLEDLAGIAPDVLDVATFMAQLPPAPE